MRLDNYYQMGSLTSGRSSILFSKTMISLTKKLRNVYPKLGYCGSSYLIDKGLATKAAPPFDTESRRAVIAIVTRVKPVHLLRSGC